MRNDAGVGEHVRRPVQSAATDAQSSSVNIAPEYFEFSTRPSFRYEPWSQGIVDWIELNRVLGVWTFIHWSARNADLQPSTQTPQAAVAASRGGPSSGDRVPAARE